MASEDSSFNASGPTVVAFETITGPSDRSFGVSVSGSVCGVFGQGTEGSSQNDRTSPLLTGILGRGDSHGVYGVSGTLDIASQAQDFTGMTAEGMAVIGVNQTKDPDKPSPAILGLNDVLNGDFDSATNAAAAASDAAISAVAIEGLSRTGHGVCGIALNLPLDRSQDLPDDPSVFDVLKGTIVMDPTTRLPDSIGTAGVIGIAMSGPGLRGVSLTDRGGVFESAANLVQQENQLLAPAPPPVGQIRLVPHVGSQFTTPGGGPVPGAEPPLPKQGKMGDLLALATIDSNRQMRADLWLCVGADHDTGNAVWGRFAFARTVIGTA